MLRRMCLEGTSDMSPARVTGGEGGLWFCSSEESSCLCVTWRNSISWVHCAGVTTPCVLVLTACVHAPCSAGVVSTSTSSCSSSCTSLLLYRRSRFTFNSLLARVKQIRCILIYITPANWPRHEGHRAMHVASGPATPARAGIPAEIPAIKIEKFPFIRSGIHSGLRSCGSVSTATAQSKANELKRRDILLTRSRKLRKTRACAVSREKTARMSPDRRAPTAATLRSKHITTCTASAHTKMSGTLPALVT
mmetsp:Transcript_49842/g.73215  ORF Transcript_49842/g.73215 Transcript_49842/m.73215 type:complete len:250 (+) Transcript_49842:569-1318(+)